MKRSWIKSLPVIAALLAFASCSPPEPEQPKPWAGIDLPLASHLRVLGPPPSEEDLMRHSHDVSHRMSITVNSLGHLKLDATETTLSNLVHTTKEITNRWGTDIDVIFFADSNAAFKDCWTPISELNKLGVWKFKFAAELKKGEEPPVIGTAGFATPDFSEHSDNSLLPVPGEQQLLLSLELMPDVLMFNGREITFEQLDSHFAEHADKLKMAAIVIQPSMKTLYSRVVRMLDLLSKYEIGFILMGEGYHGPTTEPPYPTIVRPEFMSV